MSKFLGTTSAAGLIGVALTLKIAALHAQARKPDAGAVRQMRTSLRLPQTSLPYAAQRPRHSAKAAARFSLKLSRL